MRQRRRSRLSHDGEDDDPMSVVSNLFDVAMVFALALMVALVSRYNMTEMFSKDNFTMVKTLARRIWKSLPRKDRRSIVILLLKTKAINLATRVRKWVSLTSWRMAKLSMFQNETYYNLEKISSLDRLDRIGVHAYILRFWHYSQSSTNIS